MDIAINITNASLQKMTVSYDTIGNISNAVEQIKALVD